MKRIYKGKSKLRILIDTKCDLSGYEDVSIVFMKPDESQFTVSAVVKDVETGIIFYDVQSEEELDQSGWWTLWPEVRFDDDRTTCGRAVRFFVYEAGNG